MLNKIKKALNNNKGFTLIEMMVVIVIIAILAAIALPTFSGMLNDARDSAAMAEARSVYTLAFVEEEMGRTYTTADIATAAGVDSGDIITCGVDSSTGELVVEYQSESGSVVTITNGVVEVN